MDLDETEWPASGKTVLHFELYEAGKSLVQMNSYKVLKEDPVLWVNSRHNNSLLTASVQLDSNVTGFTLESNYVTPTVRYITQVANYWDFCPFRIYPKFLGLFYFISV
jgi:hypothetical protein